MPAILDLLVTLYVLLLCMLNVLLHAGHVVLRCDGMIFLDRFDFDFFLLVHFDIKMVEASFINACQTRFLFIIVQH